MAGPSKPHGTGGSVEHARAVFQLEMELLRPCLPHARCFAPPSSPSAPPQLATCASDFDTCLVKRSESLASPGYPRSNPNPNPNPTLTLTLTLTLTPTPSPTPTLTLPNKPALATGHVPCPFGFAPALA